MSGIWNQMGTQGTAQRPTPADTPSGGASGGSGSDSATISANDFLTLLVTEMKNQDPTANTDPNEYINQLVNVNSLQQLISINQTLTTATSNPVKTGTSAGGKAPDSAPATLRPELALSNSGRDSPVAQAAHDVYPLHSIAQGAAGNLSIPKSNPAAQRVAEALQKR
jgi:flagellar basal-body rod modification protein FlgD